MSNLIVDQNMHYEFITTGDGSPSIRLSSDQWRPEAMHHCDGALTESLFIYHSLLVEALERGMPPAVLSVGLGCGYNEMITAAHFLKTSRSDELYLESFEGDKNLRETFKRWIDDKVSTPIVPNSTLSTALHTTYEKILAQVSDQFGCAKSELKSYLANLYHSQKFVIRDWLTEQSTFPTPFGVIYFDAFSNQCTPELWTENFLVHFLNSASAPRAGLATYAATGALNRALKVAGFTRVPQSGFSGKRESTKAFKG